jgi:outer membrane receptor protein involved in Fe transport
MLATGVQAASLNIPGGDLGAALDSYMKQTGVSVIVSYSAVKGAQTRGVKGNLSADDALTKLLSGTGFVPRHQDGAVMIVPSSASQLETPMQLAQANPAPRSAVETVTVTSSKLGGADVQSIPIAITALSQEQLTATQTAGGPDLIKQVPNMTFTKTNFSGYSIQIRGIGTQAISVTTDPAVAVAFNDMPFIRNHFFEQEFYDLGQLEVLRGPQGTLYGRNATAGVVNLTTARPTDQFEAMASAELGNYHQRRFEGMLNLPLVDDRVDLRIAGEWTKRQGYSFNDTTNERIDGRDLWSGRVTLSIKPSERLQTYFIWEHFSEDDDRIRSSKQLCKRAEPIYSSISATQGCAPESLYSDNSFEYPNGFSLPYVTVLTANTWLINRGPFDLNIDPYTNPYQSKNLRVIESKLDPSYKAKNDTAMFSADFAVTPALKATSQTGFSNDFMWATQDYNRFNTTDGYFAHRVPSIDENGIPLAGVPRYNTLDDNGVFCDPQLGCSSRLIMQDLVKENSWQLNQEFRLASSFSSPFNFSVGVNYLHYETHENYYVFGNSLTLFAAQGPIVFYDPGLENYVPGVSDNHQCLDGLQYKTPAQMGAEGCVYIDPNPLTKLNDNGHNYFLSQNPYIVNSYAGFGEGYYNITPDLKLTAGLRYTVDRKHFVVIPSWLENGGWGYPVTGIIDQDWGEFTGRLAANWSPKLDFTDQTLLFGSYAHGYKAGGANPPGPQLPVLAEGDVQPVHPQTFAPEFVDAFEIGTKNTLLDGALTFNASAFYYNYEGYQISQIVDRTSVNLNFNAHIKGAEIEATYEPLPGLRLNFSGGYEDAKLANGSSAIDLMDRTAGNADWVVVKPAVTTSSNCILPRYVTDIIGTGNQQGLNATYNPCGTYNTLLDPITGLSYKKDPVDVDPLGNHPSIIPPGYPGFDPLSVDAAAPPDVNKGLGLPPNNGEGFSKDLGGNRLPNAPPFTVSAGGQYTVPLSSDWAGTLRADFYWQDNSWWRVFNDLEYDKLHGYHTLNLTLILTAQNGWQVMLFDKNVFNNTAITGAFLNSDDSGLTTNVFLTDPKLIGVRVTKNW